MILTMVIEQRNRISLSVNLWMTLVARYLPERYRSGQTNRILRLAEKSMARMEKTLDIKNILQLDDDVKNLLEQLFSVNQRWLFRNQRQRFLQ